MKCFKCDTVNPDDSKFCKECGTDMTSMDDAQPSFTKTLETLVEELTRGTLFADRYEIIEKLGEGGMGKVYRVEDTKLQEDVALKLIRPEIASDKRTIKRFSNELKIARKIAHRNVCKMYELMEGESGHFITMEYISGEDLKSLIKRVGRLDKGTAVKISKQVCEGLKEAHRMGVVHRDLKPSNIMIDKEGNARIMDFGIARSLRAKGITGTGVMIGTPEYMSPEQVEGKEVDQRSDIYSLGVILYEMVTGRVPFEGDTALSIAMKHKSEIPKDPREYNTQLFEDLSCVILKCLEKDREKRFQSAKELLAELERTEKTLLFKGEKEIAVDKDLSGGKTEETPQKKRLHPLFIFGIILLGAVIIGGGYFLLNKGSQSEKSAGEVQTSEWENSIAVLPFRDLSPDQDQEHFIFGMADAINDRLTQIGVLKVISTTSVMRYRNTGKDIQQIGEELGVAHILEGSIQTEGEKIRVRAQLINAETRFHMWSDTYEQDRKSVFDVQDRVSQAIANALKVELLPDAFSNLEKDRPKSFEAYEYYLRGMNYISSRWLVTLEDKDFEPAVGMFEKALEIDPDYSLAYSGLAWGYRLRAVGQVRAVSQDGPSAGRESDKYIDKAYALDPDSAMANALRAVAFCSNDKFMEAIHSYKRALELNANLAEVNFMVVILCRPLGLYHKGIKYAKKSIELDPYFPLYYLPLGLSYSFLSESENAMPIWEKGYQMMPKLFFQYLAREQMIMGNFDKAEELIKEAEKSEFSINTIQRTKALLYAFRGEKEKALELSKMVEIYALLGMKAEALDIIEKAIGQPRAYNYLYLKNYPLFDNLRDDPRFKKILERQKKKYEERLKWTADL